MSLLRQAPVPGTRSAALQRIQAARSSLTPAELRVADRILANPGEAIALSIGEFAEMCGVAQPTVSRFARSLGFRGYPALRLEIAHDFANDHAQAAGDAADDGSSLDALRARLACDAALGSVAQQIRTAPVVEIWASPDMGFAAELIETGLRELSVPASASTVGTHWARRAAGMQPGGVVVLLSYDGESVLARHVEMAKAAKATVVSMTHTPARGLAREFDWHVGIPESVSIERSALAAAEALVAAVLAASLIAGPDGPASPWRRWPDVEEVMVPTGAGDPLPILVLPHPDRLPDRGVCIFFNGMRTKKEDAVPSGVLAGDRIAPSIVAGLLNSGRHVVLVDNPGHGDRKRSWQDVGDLLMADFESDRPALIGQSRELATALVDAVLALGLTNGPQGLSIVGQSWGGLQALLTLAGDSRIACGVAIMPICDATDLEPFRPFAGRPSAAYGRVSAEEAARLAPRPLLLVGGAEDQIAPDERIGAFVDFLAPAYDAVGASDLLRHVTLPGVGHAFAAGQVEEAVRWLTAHGR